jgi:hypothetical protein
LDQGLRWELGGQELQMEIGCELEFHKGGDVWKGV